MKKTVVILFLLALLLLPASASAKALDDDQVIFGGTFVLHSGEQLTGDIVVIGGVATFEKESVVNGDVVLLGGSINADGTVNGNLVGIAGTVKLGEEAVINGDLATIGASLQRSESAVIRGQVVIQGGIPISPQVKKTQFPPSLSFPRIGSSLNPFVRLVWFVFRVLLWGFLATILVIFFPKQVEHVAKLAFLNPANAVGAGLVGSLVSAVAIFLMAVTLILIPVSFVSIIALSIAWVLGFIAIGYEIGARFAESVHGEWAPALVSGLGTMALMFVTLGVEQIVPCVGFLPRMLVGFWGFGAVILTRFGTQPSSFLSSSEGGVDHSASDQEGKQG